MELAHGIHLGYCTNIHRGETWDETFVGLDQYTLRVKDRVCRHDGPYGIGLRLSASAAAELAADASKLTAFRHWLDQNNCYVFTINGFPYGKFHGTRVKEQVYAPDWTSQARVDYTVQLFELIDTLAPEGIGGSVSTLPGSFKEFLPTQPSDREAYIDAIVSNFRQCSDAIQRLIDRSGKDLHLGVEPEPLGYFETSTETASFFERLTTGTASDTREQLLRTIGVNYDTCHLALEFESATDALQRLRQEDIRISKIHLSSALKLTPTEESQQRLADFQDDVYLHQVIIQRAGTVTQRFRDIPDALTWAASHPEEIGDEWRVHFHVPIHAQPEALFGDTRDHITDTLKELSETGSAPFCTHFEMETYTWEVLPEIMRAGNVIDQLEREYHWCLGEFDRVGLR